MSVPSRMYTIMAQQLGYLLSAYAAAPVLSPAPSASTDAVDVPFKLKNISVGTEIEGVGKLDNGHFTANGVVLGRSYQINGEIGGDVLTIEAYGALAGGSWSQSCNANGSTSPTIGRVSVDIAITCKEPMRGRLSLDLPAVAAMVPLTIQAAIAPAASAPPVDPIDETYVAVNPAKVREQPDVTAPRVRTIDVGQKINVMGKLRGQDWYLVSEDDKPIGYVIANQLVPESQYHPVVASAAPAAPAAIAPSPPPAPAPSAIPPALADIDFGRYQALVIGNDNYAVGLPALKTAAGDAQAVAQMLKNDYGFKVTVLLNATRAQIIGALAKYRQTLTWDDSLLIYYAGHGSFDQAGNQGYWLPVDAAPDDPTDWVSNTDITTMLKAIQARHVMVVADSCYYSGTLTRDANVGIRDADYIQRIVQKKARTVMTSGGLEPVADTGSGGHSVFAAAFIAALQQNNGVMDAQSFFAKVREPVVLAAPQTPEYSDLRFAGHEGGDFVFVRRP